MQLSGYGARRGSDVHGELSITLTGYEGAQLVLQGLQVVLQLLLQLLLQLVLQLGAFGHSVLQQQEPTEPNSSSPPQLMYGVHLDSELLFHFQVKLVNALFDVPFVPVRLKSLSWMKTGGFDV